MKNKKLISLLVTSALLVAPTSAFAGQTSTPKSIPSATSQLDIVGSYSVEDTLKLLLAGTGPVAEKNPELVRFLGFADDRPATDEAALEELITDYVKFAPKTTASVQNRLASGQPREVEKALSDLTSSFQDYLKSKSAASSNSSGIPVANAAGCGAFKVCVGVTVLAVANGVVYANVAAATFAVATLAVAWVYLMDDPTQSTAFERDEFIAKMTRALNN
ncbi:hypothetical protein [Glutamicibacter nicotianae]|uniref:hypothetical protein n=1 Tax=Glutamicibacter nicotianae TaxID=37929 RepID=UPI001959A058|nr:hypothetical protein [Glutamicibacter nicotianae]